MTSSLRMLEASPSKIGYSKDELARCIDACFSCAPILHRVRRCVSRRRNGRRPVELSHYRSELRRHLRVDRQRAVTSDDVQRRDFGRCAGSVPDGVPVVRR